jgi:hypothetical protein
MKHYSWIQSLIIVLVGSRLVNSYSTSPNRATGTSRSKFLQSAFTTVLSVSTASTLSPPLANAADSKLYNLPPSEIAAIVQKDLEENAFLTNGKLTRSIYDESATFTDEIDTYKLDQWIKGTQKLFVGPPGSRVSLSGPVEASDKEISFRFEEDLMFNIPFKPVVALSGKVVLERDLNTGLIVSYREFWDQDVTTVLKSAKFK